MLAHGSNASIRIGMIQYHFDANHIGSTSNPNFISLQVDLIKMFWDFFAKKQPDWSDPLNPLAHTEFFFTLMKEQSLAEAMEMKKQQLR